MKAILRTALALITAFSVISLARADDTIVIKFSHVAAKDTPKGRAADKFKELAEARTHGKVKVEVYPNSSLYKDKEEMEALQLGAVQMLAPAVSKFGPLGVKEYEVFDLPFMFDDEQGLHKVLDGKIGKGLFSKLDPKGITGLAYWPAGFRHISANKPIRKPDDAKGLKFRIPGGDVLKAQTAAMGAIPQILAFSEVYQALQTGVVDGTEATPNNFYTQKMFEVQKYFTLTGHTPLVYAAVVNKKFWDGLPADIRTELEGAMKDATAYANDIARKDNQDSLDSVKQSGKTEVLTLSPAEKAAWKKTMLKVHNDPAIEKRVGKETIQAVYKETGFDPNKL